MTRGRRWAGPMLLAATVIGLAAGGAAAAAGAGAAARGLWAVTSVLGLAAAAGWTAMSLRRHEVGVDLVAVLALAGCLATGELFAGAVISVMLATGRSLEAAASRRAGRQLAALLSRAPQTVRRVHDGGIEVVPADAVIAGDRVVVATGEVVPVDGIVVGWASLDESALTGEPLPVEREPGSAVRSGVVNIGNALEVRASAPAAESTYAGIVKLVEQAQNDRAPFVRMADRYALALIPLTLVVAGVAWLLHGSAVAAVAVLVVATPCPLILAAPVALVGGLSQAAKRGVVVKGGSALERLAQAQILLFDKTGTLTAGRPTVRRVAARDGVEPDAVLRLAAAVDQVSAHPLATAVVSAASHRGLELPTPTSVSERHGYGVEGVVDRSQVAVGRASWLVTGAPGAWLRRLQRRAQLESAILVIVRVDGQVAGAIVLDDPLRPDAARTIRTLRQSGFRRIVLATGDRSDVAEAVGSAIGVDEVLAERLPEDKLEAVVAARRRGAVTVVGDGINDAPALAAADVGIALGARGATASSAAADVVIVVDRLDRVAVARDIASRTHRIALQSVLGGMALTAAAMCVAAGGLLVPAAGALVQEAIDVAAIVAALRAVRPPRHRRLRGADAVLGRDLEREHESLKPALEDLRHLADRLSTDQVDADAVDDARLLHTWLVEQVLPHERREEHELYPRLAAALGEPMGALSRGHLQIEHLVHRLGRLLGDIGGDPADPDDVFELRRLLYALHAVLELHFAQEDDAVFPRIEEHQRV